MDDDQANPWPDAEHSFARWTVPPGEDGWRLDAFLAQHLAISRREVRRLLDAKHVRVNGRAAGPRGGGMIIKEGAIVEAGAFRPSATLDIIPQPDFPLEILNRADGWLIVNKPAGMPVHPLREGETGTVLNGVCARFPQVQGVGEAGLRSGVVHRLDVDTSGALAIALDQVTWQLLRSEFKLHHAVKVYRALVLGRLTGEGRELLDLTVVRHRPARVGVVPQGTPGARRCTLTWRVVQLFPGATLIDIGLGTGFLHQIRAMMGHLGHPVLGDAIYGGDSGLSARLGVTRPLLHAGELRVGPAHAVCPNPADLDACILKLSFGSAPAAGTAGEKAV